MMSIIVYLSSILQRLLVVVRTGICNNTACILPIVLVVSRHLLSEGVCSYKLSMYYGITLIDS